MEDKPSPAPEMELWAHELLETGNENDMLQLLKTFNDKYENDFHPVGFKKDYYRRIWKLLQNFLRNSSTSTAYLTGLKALRILSRDKNALNDVTDADDLKIMIKLAGLSAVGSTIQETSHHNENDTEVIIEAQKCLSNMIYNSVSVQKLCISNPCIASLSYRLKSFKDPNLPIKVKYFDVRLLFLLSALCARIRPSLQTEYHCLSYLIENMDYTIKAQNELSALSTRHDGIFQKDICELICEMLKLLYNLLLCIDRLNPDEEDRGHCVRLMSIISILLKRTADSFEMTDELQKNSINLLLVIPPDLYLELIEPFPAVADTSVDHQSSEANKCKCEYSGKDMAIIVTLLDFLHRKLLNPGTFYKESIGPVLTLMTEMCQTHQLVRKFVRAKVLPPLRDVMTRPEEGESTRNKLCKLMTCPDPDMKFLSANFLFVLCKENVDRLVKYTGFGNAAGLLAAKGLMLGRTGNAPQYSSESEDSDTDEYEKMKDKVNPVTGFYEPSRPSPMQNMTDEQKEYEAMKLVDALDKLSRLEMMHPCRLGEDGRPHPIESVLQLQQEVLRSQGTNEQENLLEDDSS